jgi:pilus assembly protein Flp/PilA
MNQNVSPNRRKGLSRTCSKAGIGLHAASSALKNRQAQGHAMKNQVRAPASPIRSALADLWADERGATAIEYGLIAALMVVVVVAGMQAVGVALKENFYDKIANIF